MFVSKSQVTSETQPTSIPQPTSVHLTSPPQLMSTPQLTSSQLSTEICVSSLVCTPVSASMACVRVSLYGVCLCQPLWRVCLCCAPLLRSTKLLCDALRQPLLVCMEQPGPLVDARAELVDTRAELVDTRAELVNSCTELVDAGAQLMCTRPCVATGAELMCTHPCVDSPLAPRQSLCVDVCRQLPFIVVTGGHPSVCDCEDDRLICTRPSLCCKVRRSKSCGVALCSSTPVRRHIKLFFFRSFGGPPFLTSVCLRFPPGGTPPDVCTTA